MQEISNYSFELTTNSMKPEGFRAWQSSFLNGIQDLELTASEELDLLVKWIGRESSDHVKRIHAAYIINPKAPLYLSSEMLCNPRSGRVRSL